MVAISRFWRQLSDVLFRPRVESLNIPSVQAPGFWLLGKTQSGKTSLVRALTGCSRAEIGNGFTPCTRQTAIYDFPAGDHPLIRFIDTRGLEETGYDPVDDIDYCRQQAQVLLVVMRALDMNQGALLAMVETLKQQRPDWPLIVVQSSLHEGYRRGQSHVLPYPYDQDDWPRKIPNELAQAIEYQRRWFRKIPVTGFVAVDFTLPEDELEPCDYGLDALWQQIDLAWPYGVVGLLRGSAAHKDWQDHHARAAHSHIIGYAVANVGLGAVPGAGLPLMLASLSKMLHSIASIYQLPLDKTLFTEFASLMGGGIGFAFAGRELIKLVPVYGWALAGVYSGATTYGLGKAFCVYLHARNRGAMPEPAVLKAVYQDAFAEARRQLRAGKPT